MTKLAEVSFSLLPAAPAATLGTMLEAAATSDTPALLVSPLAVTANFQRIQAAFPQAQILYAIKANPHPSVTRALMAAGCGLDVASGAEVAMAAALQAHPQAICFSAPFKRPRDIAAAYALGIRLFVADSPGEVVNIARHAPGSRLLLRMAVTGGNALTPMGRKFGANSEDIPGLAHLARRLGLSVEGLHFHVGSQCIDALAWSRAVGECAPLWHALRDSGFDMRLIDIGGGFPVAYDHPVPSIEEIAQPTLAAIRVWMGPDVAVALEPGRWMTQDAAVLVTEVIGIARRGDEEWVYLDAGVYNGLIDTTEGVVYPLCTADEVRSGRLRPRRRVTLAGPSCDGNDVLMRGVNVPALEIGDRLLFAQAGAYTTAFERFNGLSFPEVVELSA